MVFSDIKKMCSHTTSQTTDLGRLNPQENVALQSLIKNDELIIKTADKGGGIVIQNQTNYKETDCLLADHLTYCKLTTNPLPEYKIEINKLIDSYPTKNYQ